MAAVEIEQPSSPANVLTLETTLPKTDTDNHSFSSTSTDRKTSSSTSSSKDPTKRIRYSARTPQTMTISPTETNASQSKKAKRRSFSFFKSNSKGEKKKDSSEKLNRSSDTRRLTKSQTAEKRIKRRSFLEIFQSSSESEIEPDNSSSPFSDSKSKRRSLMSESYKDEDRTRNNRAKNRLSLNLDLFTSKSSTRGIPGETSTSIGIPSFLTNSLSIISAPTSPATERPKSILKRSLSQGQRIYKNVENAVKGNSYKNELGDSEVNTPATSLAEADVGENDQDNDFAADKDQGKGETQDENKDRENNIENKGQNQKEFDSSNVDHPNLLSPPLSPSLPPPPPTTPTPQPLTTSLNAIPILKFTEAFAESPVDREFVIRNANSSTTGYEKLLKKKDSEASDDTLFQSQRTESPSQYSYESLLIRQLNLAERMEATLRRLEDKFGETDKREDLDETVLSKTVEREQRKDDARTDELTVAVDMQEKVKNLETQLSEQKAELDVLREVVLDLCVSLGLEERSNQQLLITGGDLSSYDPSNLSLIHSRLTGSFPPHQKQSQSTTSILVNSLVVKPVAATMIGAKKGDKMKKTESAFGLGRGS
ncbi:10369_t:CDS:2 [Paraglomus occultum]|uniref:10369_t:CDS:1 n=1 Tax=Paraglomus occultum TaxID=144539 RepID=A0A9N9AZ42_9GLOM|nr:10369_t:CDS:2 [Paraglomus occultum]